MWLPSQTLQVQENLLCERRIFSTNDGSLRDPLTAHKGTPQEFIPSPILFNFYLQKIASILNPDTHILQYADDVVLFSSLQSITDSRNSLAESLESLHSYFRSRRLDLAPHKSKIVIFSRRRNNQFVFQNISLRGIDIPRIPKIDSARFLGVILDEKLDSKAIDMETWTAD